MPFTIFLAFSRFPRGSTNCPAAGIEVNNTHGRWLLCSLLGLKTSHCCYETASASTYEGAQPHTPRCKQVDAGWRRPLFATPRTDRKRQNSKRKIKRIPTGLVPETVDQYTRTVPTSAAVKERDTTDCLSWFQTFRCNLNCFYRGLTQDVC